MGRTPMLKNRQNISGLHLPFLRGFDDPKAWSTCDIKHYLWNEQMYMYESINSLLTVPRRCLDLVHRKGPATGLHEEEIPIITIWKPRGRSIISIHSSWQRSLTNPRSPWYTQEDRRPFRLRAWAFAAFSAQLLRPSRLLDSWRGMSSHHWCLKVFKNPDSGSFSMEIAHWHSIRRSPLLCARADRRGYWFNL